MTYIFVYGTLKQGQPNYYRLTDVRNGTSQFCCSARTVESFPLVIAGKYNIPFLLNEPGSGLRVRGEVYRVDDEMLHFLDEYESCPHMYQRTLVQLQVDEWHGEGDRPDVFQAFVYSTKTYQPEWLRFPRYDNYDSYGDHGLRYVPREERD